MDTKSLDIDQAKVFIKPIKAIPKGSPHRLETQRLAVSQLIENAGLNPNLLTKTTEGKPFLIGENQPFISISHTASYAAIALSAHPVGLDIEHTSVRTLRVLPRIINAIESTLISFPADTLLATKVWSLKEAVFKLYGTSCKTISEVIISSFTETEAYTAPPFQAIVRFEKKEDLVIALAAMND